MPNYSSKHYAEVSRRFAEGTPEEVQALGGTRSAIASSALAYAYAVAPEDTPVEEFMTENEVVIQPTEGLSIETIQYVDSVVGNIETILQDINSGD